MNTFTSRRIIPLLASAILTVAASTVHADVALVRALEGPSGSSGNLFSGAKDDTRYGIYNKSWNPSFRTASSSTAIYTVGWTESNGTPTPNEDGFITKINPAGSEVWSKSMREIMGSYAGTYGWRIDDVETLRDFIYVCGQNTNKVGFVAKITEEGSLVDYSLIVASGSGTIQFSESDANSLAVSIVNGVETVVVVGNAKGATMSVKERQVTNATDTFGNLVLLCEYGSEFYSDAYIIRFDKDLKANWGTTLGFVHTDDYATAVETDPLGSIFVALHFMNPDRHQDARHTWLDDGGRKVIFDDNLAGYAITGSSLLNFNFYEGSHSTLIRLDSSDNTLVLDGNNNITGVDVIAGQFVPCVVESVEQFSDNRIKDIKYTDGSLYIAGEWKKYLRPGGISRAPNPSDNDITDFANANGLNPLADGVFDIFVARLDALTLADQKWRFYQSAGNGYASEITVSSEGVYLSAVASGSVSHRNTLTIKTDAGETIGGSSNEHLLWTKLSVPDLNHVWAISPVESGTTYQHPSHQRAAGIGFLNNTAILTGYWGGGAINFGEVSNDNVKTLESPPSDKFRGFAGFVSPEGDWFNEVQVRINSQYGNVTPHKGVDVVAAGNSIVASVPPVVYETAAGSIIDPSNEDLISRFAVTRRINTGYQFKNSNINGTVNSVTFEATTNVELTFLWRTEHAIDVLSDIDNTDGLSSTAAGNPTPEVKKHWFPENEPFTAFIDGAAVNASEFGTRWRSTGYVATGSIALAAGVDTGSTVNWSSFQDRQQTAAMTVVGPGSIKYKWEKELSVRVGVNTSVANGSPSLSYNTVEAFGAGEYWYPEGASITARSSETVNSGLSDLSLKGYLGATGSITPAEGGTNPIVFDLEEPTNITWDYGPTIFKETVMIGQSVGFNTVTGASATRIESNKRPESGVIQNAPPGSAWPDMFRWDQVNNLAYPVVPGAFTLEFENSAAPDDSAKNIIIEVTAVLPQTPSYNHVIEAPSVDLDPSSSDFRAFIELAYTEGDAAAPSNLFDANESGRSVLVFSARSGSPATGNLQQESLSIKVVNSFFWAKSLRYSAPESVTIGTEISPLHDIETIGHNGYILTDLAPINVNAYDRETLTGAIFPVNVLLEYPQFDAPWPDDGNGNRVEDPRELAIAWYTLQDGIRWPSSAKHYKPQWPDAFSIDRIVIASRLGTEGQKTFGAEQELWTEPSHKNHTIYNQANRSSMGFNPNEEHALIAPSFLDGTRQAAFALRTDLNQDSSFDASYTSAPFVLVQYETSELDNPTAAPQIKIKMKAYSVVEEDATVTDTRLDPFNQAYTYFYQNEAGQRLVPPYPLDLVIGGAAVPEETEGQNIDERVAYFEDKNNMPWVVSGDIDAAKDIETVWYYPLRADFWHPTAALGDAVRYGALDNLEAFNIDYNTIWPETAPVLKAGETLTFAGGEYATDNSGASPAPEGLPQAVAWQSGEIVFDAVNPTMSGSIMANNYLVRLIPALESREVPLALAQLPVELTPGSGDVTVKGTLWHFDALPAGLKDRIYYDTNKQVLGVRGLLNGRTLGDGDLLATPGAQTILQPNVLTAPDKEIIRGISTNADWISAVDLLVDKSMDPNATNTTIADAFMAGLVRDTEFNELEYQSAYGPGLAVVTNPKMQDPAQSGAFPEGYITIAENNDPELSTPVAMHVIKVSREKYRGSIAVLEPNNVFDEKLSLRHTADFGGNVEDLYFQWFYREEDGRNLNPPEIANPTAGTPNASDWVVFDEGRGLSEVQMAGTGPVLIRDNLFFCRYGFSSDGNPPSEWSAYAGAANSREPDTTSPSVATDIAYVAQLAAGWIKRVTNAVNAFDARISDFGNNDVPATYTSMLQQAGQRHEGAVAFNPDKDAIENVGLIELYQTVLDRAEDLSIETQSGSTGVNTALLNAANRIASLYTLLGNEAFADSLDPTIGFTTQSGSYGNLAPTIHAFENVTPSLLEEEIALLRGRSEVGARPSYNRLIWNFTNGAGEAAYVLNYDISDLTEDGFINEEDAQRLYPQGHGDAWGHYTKALSGYYRLAQIDNFTWEPRSEKYNIGGIVLDVDYLDERAFARTAAARAQTGTALVDLIYKQKYTENPNGQWQGYTDTDTDRAWGLYETAQRSGTAALCDWMMGNAILKGEESDPAKTGILKVDRTTVGELGLIAANAQSIQSTLDAADRGMNPAGLDPNVIPFDIDPALTDRTQVNAATHFEQIYNRAVAASQNALRSFDYANNIALQLRETEASTEQLRQASIDQDRSLRNQMIEVFGTPYEGMIGAGKAYPAGYNGPDLYLYLYVNQVAAGGDILPDVSPTIVETTIVPGLRQLATDTNPFAEGGVGVDSALIDTVSTYFPADLGLPTESVGEITLNLPRQASGYALVAPNEWGARRSPGKIQAAIQDLVKSEWQLRTAISKYESQADDFQNLLKKFELISGIAGESIEISRQSQQAYEAAAANATEMYSLGLGLSVAAEFAYDLVAGLSEFLPEIVGLSFDPSSAGRGVFLTGGAIVKGALLSGSAAAEVSQYKSEIDMEGALANLDRALVTQDRKIEIVELLFEINDLINAEGDAVLDVIATLESMRASSDRVLSTIQEGIALIEERTVFNQRVAATTTKQRYEDYTFRVFHNEALRKYRSSFDLATRYAYLAGKAYQYELNLPDNHAANASPILSSLLRERTLGQWDDAGEPVIGQSGIAEHLGVLKANYEALKGQLGFNNPTDEVYTFSLRRELERVGMSNRVSGNWRTALENYRVPDLWNYEYQNNGVNYGYVFRRYCRPFAAEAAGAQPALVIPFTTTIEVGKNWFGKVLSGGDSSFNSSDFSTKIRAVGVRFDGYNGNTLSQTPQVYLVPVGADKMYLPNSNSLESRSWNVVDQRIPAPLPITSTNLNDPDWQPYSGSANGFFEDIRKFSSFRAYNDAGGWSEGEMLNNGRHVGRSVWNTQWILIIPNASLLYDSANTQAGIDTLIYGAPLPTYTQSTAGTTNRDLIGIEDIRILIDSYSISGN